MAEKNPVGTNVGPEPAEAKPNHVREKTYKEPNAPARMTETLENLPEKTAEDHVREGMHDAVEKVKRQVR